MNSPSTTHKKPQLLWATPADTATAIPIAASTAIEAGAPRPDGRSGWAAEDAAATRARGSGRVLGRSRRRSFSSPQVRAARARPVRSSNSSGVSLPAWKFSLRSDRTASRSASEALISAEFPDLGFIRLPPFHLVPLCLCRRADFVHVQSPRRQGIVANARCHQPEVTSVTASGSKPSPHRPGTIAKSLTLCNELCTYGLPRALREYIAPGPGPARGFPRPDQRLRRGGSRALSDAPKNLDDPETKWQAAGNHLAAWHV